jgi:hypothetical protein
LPLPGITITLGPGGIVAQPASIITTDTMPATLFSFIFAVLVSLLHCRRDPSARQSDPAADSFMPRNQLCRPCQGRVNAAFSVKSALDPV